MKTTFAYMSCLVAVTGFIVLHGSGIAGETVLLNPGMGIIAQNTNKDPINQDEDIQEGTYYIICAKGGKYLDVSWSCRNEHTCKVQLWSLGGTTSNNKWVIKKEGLPYIGGYTIKSMVNNHYLTSYGDDNGDPLDVEPRFGIILTDLRATQEWKIKKISEAWNGDKIYKIYNKGNGKYLDAVNNCVNENGCRVQIWSDGSDLTRQWYIIKPK